MRFFIPILVGAVIGYITNWLAIKMLFRPYYEKKIFGIKVPFTPGLIPKEKDRIAKNIGETIANQLITTETITKALKSERIDEKLRSSIQYYINKVKNSSKSIRSILDYFDKDIYNRITNFIELKLTTFILNSLKAEKFKEEIRQSLHVIIINEVTLLINSEKRLDEVLPNEFKDRIKGYVIENKESITKSLKEILESPSIKIKLKKTIEDMAEEKLPKMIAMFISTITISEKVYEAIERQLDNPNTANDIAFGINKAIDKFLENQVSHIGLSISKNISHEDVSNLCEKLINHIYGKENESSYIRALEEKIKLTIRDLIEDLGNRPIKDLAIGLNEEVIENIINYTKIVLEKVAIEKLPSFIETLNISKIVEEQINSFDVSYAEKIILDISSKELKAITWLGALLGAIIGILSPLLQM